MEVSTLLFGSIRSLVKTLHFPNCAFSDHKETPHAQCGWTALVRDSAWCKQTELPPFLPSRALFPTAAGAHTCTPPRLAPCSPAGCWNANLVLFFKHQQQQHLDLRNFNPSWLPSFPFVLPGTCELSCTYTRTSNRSWKSESFGIMNNDYLEDYKTTNC